MAKFETLIIDHKSSVDPSLQSSLEQIDSNLRAKHSINATQTAIGVLDLIGLRLAMVRGDHMEYAASISKIAILLAYFHVHPQAANNLPSTTRHELGQMIKASSNEMATKFSRELGLTKIQEVLNAYGFYDRSKGGGIWMG